MAFIFQAKPSVYDLRERLSVDKDVGWLASRYYKEMKPGDIVFFWLAGDKKQRGLYGWGEISPKGVFKDSKDLYRVAVSYKKSFNEMDPPSHISYKEFQKDPVLKDLTLLHMAIGTNFILSKEEYNAINELIVKHYGAEWAPGKKE